MSGPREHRPPGPEDETVEVPLRPSRGASPPAEEPWWKNANQRVSPPPRMPAPPAAKPAPQTPAQRRDRPPTPAGNRQARAATPTRRKGGPLPVLIAVGVIAISVAAVLLWVVLSGFDVLEGKVLNVSRAEAGVRRILTDPVDGYGATSVSDVECNNGDDPEIKKGGTFTCDVVVDGRKRTVLVVFQDDNGTYEVDRPR